MDYQNSFQHPRGTRRRYTCGGDCMWRMPTKEEIEIDLSTAPPPKQTEFIGTEDEAMAAGWELAPKELWWNWRGYTVPVFLCPERVIVSRSKHKAQKA